MHQGFVNFNAGTLGPSMVEGRITHSSVVDAGADIGAGSSIMVSAGSVSHQLNAAIQMTTRGGSASQRAEVQESGLGSDPGTAPPCMTPRGLPWSRG